MKRRIRQAFMMDDDGEVSMTADTVIDDDRPQHTGLLDARGNRLYRPKEPVGFVIRRTQR